MRNTLLYLALIIGLAGCGSGDSGSGKPMAPSTGTEALNGDNTAPDEPTAGPTEASFGAPDNGQIRPGVIIQVGSSQCTSNFLYRDARNNVYIGAASHCFSQDANSGIDPCESRNEPLGTATVIENAAFVGSLAYSSWQSMQTAGEAPGSETCTGNDFALIKIDPRDLNNIHPAARVYEGPIALQQSTAKPGDNIFTYGQSPFSLGLAPLQEKQGTIESVSPQGWIYNVTLDSTGAPGDSGSAVLHETGTALGVLSTLNLCIGLCSPTANGVVNLAKAMDYANAKVFSGELTLLTWSNFNPR